MRWWRWWCGWALWAVCAGALAQPAADAPIRVGLLAEAPPFHSWPAGGRPRGFDVDLLERVAHDTGLRFEYSGYFSADYLRSPTPRSSSPAARPSTPAWTWSSAAKSTRRCTVCTASTSA